jgi:hypothetical protein
MVRVPAVTSWADAPPGNGTAAPAQAASRKPAMRVERRVTESTDVELQRT